MSISPALSDASIDLSAIDDPAQPADVLSPNFDKYKLDSDLILKSCDNILFPVHRARLAGSSVFRDMFQICGESEDDLDQSYRADIPILSLSEKSQTLEIILPFFYDQLPDLDEMDFDAILEAFEAALKYGMTLVEHILSARFRRVLLQFRPLRIQLTCIRLTGACCLACQRMIRCVSGLGVPAWTKPILLHRLYSTQPRGKF